MTLQPTSLAPLQVSAVLEYAETVRAAFAKTAEGVRDVREGWFRIAGQRVLIRATEPALFQKLTMAFAHLRAPAASSADLTIQIWDGTTSGASAPPSPPAFYASSQGEARDSFLQQARFDVRGELPAFNIGGIRTAFHLWPSVLHLLDNRRNEAFYWIEDSTRLPFYEAGAPFHRILAWWMAQRNIWLVHTAAVGTAAGGLLITGAPGAGKSTTALACAAAGMAYAGDDYCLVTTDPEPYVHSLYNTGKLKSRRDLERFPQFALFAGHAEWLDNLKAQMFLQFVPGVRVVEGFPVRAIVVPRVANSARANLSRLSAAAGLQAMLSTIRQVPNQGLCLRPLSQLVRQTPCYRMEAVPDLASIPPLLLKLLEG